MQAEDVADHVAATIRSGRWDRIEVTPTEVVVTRTSTEPFFDLDGANLGHVTWDETTPIEMLIGVR